MFYSRNEGNGKEACGNNIQGVCLSIELIELKYEDGNKCS